MGLRLRSKRRLRLAILLSVVVLMGSAGAAVYFVRMRQVRQETAQKRSKGLAAFEKGDYFTAVHALGTYIHRSREPELDVLYKYAQARRKVEEPRGAHLVQTVGVLRHVLTLDPGHAEARRDLLELYLQLRYSTEAIGTADRLLKEHPKDPEALLAKATALGQLRKFKEALAVAEEHNKLKPLDLNGRVLTFTLLRNLDKLPEDLVTRAQDLQKASPEDPCGKWLVAYAYACAKDRDKTAEWCESVARDDAIDPDLAVRTAGLLDYCGRTEEAFKLLDRVAAASSDPKVTELLAHRLWRRGRYEDLVKRFAGPIASPQDVSSELLGLCALALIRTGHKEKAEPVAAALSERKGDNRAIAWADALRGAFLNPPGKPMQLIPIWRGALERAPAHPYFHYFLANTYAVVGETDKALQSLQTAARLAPSWTAPLVKATQLLLASGRRREAFQVIRTVVARPGPGSLLAAVVFAEAWDANLREGQQKAAAKLLEVVQKIQKEAPGEPRTLVILVKLLARAGKVEDARKAVASAVESKKAPSKSLLLALARASQTHSLGMAEDCFRRYEKEHGMTCELAFARARSLARAGNPQGGLKVLKAAMEAAKPSEEKKYRLSVARYRESTDDEKAGEAWVDLAKAYPSDSGLLRSVLSAKSVWSQRDFVDKSIEKLKDFLGEKSTSWRLPRARWLLMYDPSEKGLRRAEGLLEEAVRQAASDSTSARLLLARSQEQLGNLSAALGNLTVVAYRNPELISIQLQLAALQQRQGNKDAARATISRVFRNKTVELEHVRQAAALLAAQGDLDQAIEELERAIAVQLVVLQQREAGEGTATQPATSQAVEDKPVEPKLLREATALLEAKGELDQAIARLEHAITELLQASSDTERPSGVLLLLAKLYGRRRDSARRDVQRAKAICRKLMEKPDVPVIAFAAELYASLGQPKDADAALARLGELDLKPGLAQLIMGMHYSRYSSANTDANTVPDTAISHYQKAAQEAPTNPLVHRLIIAAYIQRGAHSEAIGAIGRAVAQCRDDETLKFVQQHQDLLSLIEKGVRLRPMVAALVESPSDRTAAVDALRIIREAKAKKQPTSDVLRRLRKIADRTPRFWPLQAFLVNLYRTIRRPNDAVDLATRAMQSFPTAKDPARMAAGALAAAGRWAEALSVSREWRRRAAGQSVAADLMIADVQLRLSEPAAAVAQLQPHIAEAIAQAAKDPNANVRILLTHASALILAKKAKEADDLLFPLLAKSSAWRRRWMTLGMSVPGSAEAAGDWLKRVVPLIPRKAAKEKLALATAWKVIGERFRDTTCSTRARHILEELTTRDDTPAGAYQLLAFINEADGKLTAAEANYRRALRGDPNMALSANNLAMILLQRGGDVKEAAKLASRAVEKQPRAAAYRDTLAQVQAKTGDHDAAIVSMARALKLEPNNLEWHVNLVRILVNAGKLAKARKVLDNIDRAVTDTTRLPASIREALSGLRKTVGRPEGTGKPLEGSRAGGKK